MYRRGRYYDGARFEKAVMKGVVGPRHTSVGRFLSKNTHWVKPETPCSIPWTYIECECGGILENLGATQTTIEILRYEFDLTGSHVVFSGNKSFWIALPSRLMANPVGSVDDQKLLRKRLFLPLMEYPVDENLWDARHLRRMIGSEHERGGRVRALTLDSLFDGTWQHRSAPFVAHPFIGPRCNTMYLGAVASTRFHVRPMDDVPQTLESSQLMNATDDGVDEGRRNEIAFKRACYLVRNMDAESAFKELEAWNRGNTPPLHDHELRNCVRSAQRTAERYAA